MASSIILDTRGCCGQPIGHRRLGIRDKLRATVTCSEHLAPCAKSKITPSQGNRSYLCIGRESNPGLADIKEVEYFSWQRPILPLNHQCLCMKRRSLVIDYEGGQLSVLQFRRNGVVEEMHRSVAEERRSWLVYRNAKICYCSCPSNGSCQ
jgi:hypothetical protein